MKVVFFDTSFLKEKSIEVMKELNNREYIKIDYITPFIFRKSQEYLWGNRV